MKEITSQNDLLVDEIADDKKVQARKQLSSH